MRLTLLCRPHWVLFAINALFCPCSQAADRPPLDVNDVSFLWPAPENPGKAAELLSADLRLDNGEEIWPAEVFTQVIAAARAVQVIGSDGQPHGMGQSMPDSVTSRHNWKIAGVRIHPSSLGTSDELVHKFGSAPSLRIIFQPVKVAGSKVSVHDVAAHVVFSFITNPPATPVPSIPDEKAFGAVVDDLRAMKAKLATANVDTSGKELGVHPGFKNEIPGFQNTIAALLKKHLSGARLDIVSFMGIETPEPWIFFSMKKVNGQFITQPIKGNFGSVQGPMAQMLILQGGDPVSPEPLARSGSPQSLSTAALFRRDVREILALPALPAPPDGESSTITFADIPDRIANPDLHHNFNTDCVSCHTESARRRDLDIPGSVFAYRRPQGISGVDAAMLPAKRSAADPSWNVRNFGWFPDFFLGGKAVATVSQRAANEAAASADFLNHAAAPAAAIAGGGAPPAPVPGVPAAASPAAEEMVSHPLTLVLEIKSEEDRIELKKKLEGMQALPPSENPSRAALDSLGIVHFARFVFIGDDKIAVITAYDDSLEQYVERFVQHMGPTFDLLLKHVKDAPPLPVANHPDEFLKFVQKNDLKCIEPFYSAYPKLRVRDILTLQKRAELDQKKP